MSAAPSLGDLTPAEWERLQGILDQFETAAARGEDSADFSPLLPAAGDRLRGVLLQELIKSELEMRWRRGRPIYLEEYLSRFPELGSQTEVPASLVFEEYRARFRAGDRPPLAAYQERFPAQYGELQRLTRTVQADTPQPDAHRRQPAATVPKPALQGGYRLVKLINRGAVGEVWRAEAPGGVEVAVKIINGTVAEQQAQRELQALEVIKKLRHPFLAPIHAYWQMEDRLVIAMELADGSLHDRLEEHRKSGRAGIPPEELLPYLREAAEALDYLHQKRVIHRDIKPQNLLVLEGHAKVADFDLARLVEETRRLSAASHCGTPAYAAPEVFWRGKVGAGSDQYSLAVTYAEMRLGRPLYPSRSWFQLMQDHLRRPPDLLPLLDREQRVLLQALAKEPSDRYSSCREFVLALERCVPR